MDKLIDPLGICKNTYQKVVCKSKKVAKEIRICQIFVTPYSGIAEMLKCGSFEESIYHFNVGIATDLLRWYKP